METRPDWFQGREIAEALAVRIDAADGRFEEAMTRLERAVALAEGADLYNAAWLTVACAEALAGFDKDRVNACIDRYNERVEKLGYPEMTRRYAALVAR
jgi:hypothetical protein